MLKVYFLSLGCPKNRVDTEVMAGMLVRAGFEISPDPGAAGVLVVNTCSFIDAAKEESVDAVLELAEHKKARPDVKLVVAGCLAQRFSKQLPRLLPEVDLFIGTGEYQRIAELLSGKRRTNVATPRFVHRHDSPRLLTTAPHTAYLKVAEGCSRRCAFCIIPRLRGRQRSRDVADVVAEARALAESGVVEVNLVAQDLSHYGADLPDTPSLESLVRALDRVDGLRWIRLLYLYPRDLTDGLLDAVASCGRVVKYLDVPVQHIADGVLKRMRRGTPSAAIRDLVARARRRVPGIALRTTLLVGFPGETEEAFAQLLDFVNEVRFERLGVFTFSPEEDTIAATMPDQVPAEVAAGRREVLMEAQRAVSKAHGKALVGRTAEVLVDGLSEESDLLLSGRTAQQAPEIDGVTLLTDGTAKAGEIRRVRIYRATDYDLVGRILAD